MDASRLRPSVLLVPSLAAAVEIPRRLAEHGRALAGLYPFRLLDLARAIAEPALLDSGLKPWDAGHAALLARRLLADSAHGLDLPDAAPGPLTQALARTLVALRQARVAADELPALKRLAVSPEDERRVAGLALLYAGFEAAIEGHFADPVTLFRVAGAHAASAAWLKDAELIVLPELELEACEAAFLAEVVRIFPARRLESEVPPALSATLDVGSVSRGIAATSWTETLLAPLAPPAAPAGLGRLCGRLFEAPRPPAAFDGVELLTAAGEAAEVRAIARRLLAAAARGVPFEQMGVVLPRPHEYAPLLTDLLERIGVPHRLHPSLPLRLGRSARALLLLFRCRELGRPEVMEFLTFTALPTGDQLGEAVEVRPARWDAISREAGVTKGLARWRVGLRAFLEAERGAASDAAETRRTRHERRVSDAKALLGSVERLATTLEKLDGQRSWPEWSRVLLDACEDWLGPERDREAVREVLADVAGLGGLTTRASWNEVEPVIEARFEWERLPVAGPAGGAVHVGALDAIAGLWFRVLAIPGLAEGGFPPVLRSDPFLLDHEREALEAQHPGAETSRPRRQLSLFEDPLPRPGRARCRLPTTQDRLYEARRQFHRAISQAREQLILSYPRSDARSGRERLPSSFFVAAASALAGRPLGGAELASLVREDDPAEPPLAEALDPGERDLWRVRRGGGDAARAVAAGSAFYRGASRANRARWSGQMTAFDGRVSGLPAELAARLDPSLAPWTVSASSLATFARCGFQYLLRHVLRLEVTSEPEERIFLDPLEIGSLFHAVAESFLRERRDQCQLPIRDDDGARERLLTIAREQVAQLVAGTPPRHRLVWELRWRAFEELLLRFLSREAAVADRLTPAHFEVGFGSSRRLAAGEPHSPDPLVIELPNGRALRVSGKIDRIDTLPDGGLVLRDYKTGQPPRDDGSVFRGGRELQIPVYVLATKALFPGRNVAQAFLDYVKGTRPIAFDPESVAGPAFRALLADMTQLIAEGGFVQEPSACGICDYTSVCGPQPLLEVRRRIKRGDPVVVRYLRLRDYR